MYLKYCSAPNLLPLLYWIYVSSGAGGVSPPAPPTALEAVKNTWPEAVLYVNI